MEKELQVELMRRNGKYCVLTPEGCRFQARILDPGSQGSLRKISDKGFREIGLKRMVDEGPGVAK